MATREQLIAAIERAGDAGDADAVRELGSALSALDTPKSDNSAVRAFGLGAMKPVDNIARGAYAVLPQSAARPLRRLDDLIGLGQPEAGDRARAQNTRKGWQAAGGFVGTLPTLALPGGWAAQGAAGGALLSDATNAEDLATDAVVGIAGSGIGTGAVKGLGMAASPTVREPVKKLLERKIPMTIGQIAGGTLQRIEDAATSTLGLGHMIDSARERGVAAFNRSAFDDLLSPFGVKLPEGVEGHAAVKFTKDKFKKAYDYILENMAVPDDETLRGSIHNLTRTAATIPGDLSTTFQAFLAKEVTPYFQNGTMSGHHFKEVDRVLRKQAARYSKGSGAEQAYADLLSGLRTELRGAAGRGSDPVLVKALREADDAYANYVPIRDAASKTADGTFLPGGLDTSVRVADRSAGKGAKASGEARMQELSSAARAVLPSTLGRSGTPERALATAVLGGGAAGAASVVTPWALAVPPLLSLAYTKGGQRAVQAALTGRQGAAPQAVRRGLFGAARLAPAAAPALLMRADQ